MPAIEFSDFIDCDLQEVARYLVSRNPRAAELFLDAFQQDIRFLAENPHAGPMRKEFGSHPTRFWPITGFNSYLILYRLHASQVEIWRVVHGAKDFNRLAREEP